MFHHLPALNGATADQKPNCPRLAEKTTIYRTMAARSDYFATVIKVARTSFRQSLATAPGQVRSRWPTAKIPKRSPNFVKLAIALSLDPDVKWLEYVGSLSFGDCNVVIEMMVADQSEGRVAFDIVDERPHRDLDTEGLLLLTLDYHQIRIVETDSASIKADPRVSNSLRIWRHRDRRVERKVVAAVDRALVGQQSVSVKTLGTLIGLSEPLAIVSALISRRLLDADLSKTFGMNSLVVRRWDFGATLLPKNRSAVQHFGGKKP
jgi:hypothetical protein